ncbi:Siderophore/alcaligin biosynthesis enzyme (L-lysine 6-monooxygenase) [Paraburkholderia tropica]|uniref:lysine N(6)-hydroxylase/L-ornithine N(5)-oxygenase family protein n=1 Tax=Paraburkholderia tropica TaxID=92647 RepID=UPI001CAC2369|nr:SidA/IucD/PvdA family monooxygenase [Paraburkholderia tropica]CAG9192271.1 Siderophore/alcaligin biosynthesis enzyme (L-lysine 6-monooxygenase) [Paraburkholderia tropica]
MSTTNIHSDSGTRLARAASSHEVLDFVAIGLGPFNLSLACLADPIRDLRGLFLERNEDFDWHPGMLIDDTTLQNPFLADLVSLADPKSKFSFLNYCKQEGKLYAYYIRERFYLSRAEYNRYCKWAIKQLSSIAFGSHVERVDYDADAGHYVISGRHVRTGQPFTHRAARLVIGVGSVPQLPSCCDDVREHCLHSAQYVANKSALQQKRSIAVIGSGQSAAEIFYDLLKESDEHDYALTWITRSPRFFQMENTKLTLEMISPDYIDYFYNLPDSVREGIIAKQDSLYKGVNASLINQIYDLLDDRRSRGGNNARLITNSELTGCHHDRIDDRFHLRFVQRDEGVQYTHVTDGAIFATGYGQNVPAFIDGIRERISWDARGRYKLSRNYAIDVNGGEVFVQNAGLYSHGLTNPDLGMSCYRNSCILRELTGVEHYKIERRIALQDFSVPDTEAFVKAPLEAQ